MMARHAIGGVIALALVGCERATEAVVAAPPDLAGTWRAVLASPGGELPFRLEIERDGESFRAAAVNGEERAPFSHVAVDGRQVELGFSWYDAEIRAELSADGAVMRGRWRKTAAGGKDSALDFSATRGMAVRFLPPPATASAPFDDVSDAWSVEFTDEDGTEPARGEFVQTGTQVEGTFLTPTGDYRYLEGSYANGRLRLSTFDGAHAFLFTASARPDGSLHGDFWSRDTYHATWRAVRAGSGDALPDAWSQVELTTTDQTISFAFEDLDGEVVTLADERFAGKPVIVNLFGSWCPNCNDEAPLLARWYREHRERGLEMVGLAFEYTGDAGRDREMVRRFRDRHGIDYPLLIAGTSDKADAAAAIGFLDRVLAYPTTIFLDRDHQVVKIHSGFAGPGTGEHYTALVAVFEAEIERLLADY